MRGESTLPLFSLGTTVITKEAEKKLDPESVRACFIRHHIGDWGDACQSDKQANEDGLAAGDGASQLFSVYHDSRGTKFYIKTEWDRSVSTVYLPEEG